jgi:hypothetical protein
MEGWSSTSYFFDLDIDTCFCYTWQPETVKTKLRGLSPHANYTDRAAAAGRRS